MPGFRLPGIDPLSFFLGFATATLIAFYLFRHRQQIAGVYQATLGRLPRLRERLLSNVERNLRQDVLRLAQTQHLAGAYFAIDDIVMTPRVIAPEPPLDPSEPVVDESLGAAIPVLPDWPDLAAVYRAPTLSMAEALAGDAHLLVLGGPGTGKTTLLAWLASRAALDDTSLFPDSTTPLLVHAADLPLDEASGGDVAQPLITAIVNHASPLVAARLPRFLRNALNERKFLILIDGFDEMSPRVIAEIAAWLQNFQKAYGRQRFVLAAGTSGYASLLPLGVAPVLIAPWNADDYRTYIRRWATAWDDFVRARRRSTVTADIDSHLIMGWLGSSNQGRTIFEVTLKIWAAFAGDARGKRPVDWLEGYVLRHDVNPLAHRALRTLAVAILSRENAYGLTRAEAQELLDPVFIGPAGRRQIDTDDFLDDMLNRGMLVKRANDRLNFRHRLSTCYLAAMALADDPEHVVPSLAPGWTRALYFYTALGDLTPIVARRLNQTPDLMHNDLMGCALWLRDAPANARWRGELFRRLSQLLHDESLPDGLRIRALAGFVAANDPSTAAFFKQGLNHPDPVVRRLSALGLGALGDATIIQPVAARLTDPDFEVRQAAVLALSVIRHQASLQALTHVLYTGDDSLRRGVAEALAHFGEDGPNVLQSAIAHEDLRVRRAAVYGLAAVGTEWAVRRLETVQTAEQQWFVRNAAVDVLASLQDPNVRAPRAYQRIDTIPWLVEWAAKRGMAIPPGGRGAVEVLNRALGDGDELVKRAAAQVLARLGQADAAPLLFPLLEDETPDLRESAYRALAEIAAASGARLMAPV